MLNLPLFARVGLLSAVVLGGGFPVSAAEFRSVSAELIAQTFDYQILNPALNITAISGDGSTIGGSITETGVIYYCLSFGCGTSAFVWSLKEEKHLPLSQIPLGHSVWKNAHPEEVSALSDDGRSALVVSEFRHFESAIHREGSTKLLRDSVDFGQWLRATDFSSDGSIVVGSLGGEPFRWTESSGLQSLSGIASDSPYGPVAISGDGQAVLLNDRSFNRFLLSNKIYQNAIRWNEIDGSQELLPLVGADYSQVTKSSLDGSVIVGASYSAADITSQATAWIEGEPVLLEIPTGYDSSSALDVSADGQIIIGSTKNIFGGVSIGTIDDAEASPFFWELFDPRKVDDLTRQPLAILWRDGEAFVLQDLLMEQYGLANELAGWHLTTATAISDDGTVIAGQGIDPDGFVAAWVATLVIPEPASLSLLLCLLMPMAVGRRRY